jgi:hypothetical protein
MRLAFGWLAVLLSTSVAAAQPSTPTTAPTATPPPAPSPAARPAEQPASASATEEKIAVGIAVNPPLQWGGGTSVGVSGYIGFAEHHAIRMNVATWLHGQTYLGELAAGEAIFSGRITDVGAGYQYYTRGLFEGITLEGGLLRRAIDTREQDENATPAIVETKGTGVLARALVGYSFLIGKHVFLAPAIGMSMGRYAGTERTAATDYMPQFETHDFVRYEPAFEAYFRIGLVTGL